MRILGSGLAMAAALTATAGAKAQERDEQGGAKGDIIVTAQKVEQKLREVPISISAVTAAEIEARGATNIEDLQYSVPGLSIVSYGPGQQFIQIRGISNTLGASTVGIYLDELSLAGLSATDQPDIRLLDMERIEVLRGPQSTLYGEGSMGGTIRYITANPDLKSLRGWIEGEVGAVEDGGTGYQLNGVVSVPLITDVLGLRVVAAHQRVGGWVDSAVTGEDDVNAADLTTIRGKLLFQPTDNTELTLLALYQEGDQDYQNFGSDRVTASVVETSMRTKTEIYNGVFSHDFGGVRFVQSLGYVDNRKNQTYDFTAFYLPFLGLFGVPPGAVTAIAYSGPVSRRSLVSETRLSSNEAGPLTWNIGFSYNDTVAKSSLGLTTTPTALPFVLLSTQSRLTSEVWAVFGDATYQFTEALSATVGLRYFEDRRRQRSQGISFGVPSTDINRGTFDTLNPRVNLRYVASQDSMFYANVAKGFRSGGFNLTSAGGGLPIPPTYEPDEVWTYEVGTKQALFDRALELDFAVYYQDWNDVQSYNCIGAGALCLVSNSGNADGFGVDAQAVWHVVQGLDISGTFGWNNVDFSRATGDKLVGDPVDFAASNSGSVSVDYRTPLFGHTAFFRADYQHVGKAQITGRNFGNVVVKLPPRDTVNLRFGVDLGTFEASIFATNLFDDDAPLIPGPYGVIAEDVEQRPRTVGANLKARF